MKLKVPIHIIISNVIPGYKANLKKRSKKQIQEVMRKYEFDEEYVEAIDDRFCEGFGVARDIIIEMLSTQYWVRREKEKGGS